MQPFQLCNLQSPRFSPQILFQPLFYGTVTPLLAWFALKKLLLDPWEARKKAKINERNQEEKSKK